MGSENAELWEVSLDEETVRKLRGHARGRSLADMIEEAIRQGVDLLGSKASAASKEMPKNLSPRQQQVLKYLRQGLSVKEICLELGIGEASVRTHITRLRERLATEDLLALRFGIQQKHM